MARSPWNEGIHIIVVVVVIVIIIGIGFLVYWGITGDLTGWLKEWTSDCNPLEQAMGICTISPLPSQYKDCFSELDDEGYVDYVMDPKATKEEICPILRYTGTECDTFGTDLGCTESDYEGVFCDNDLSDSITDVLSESDFSDDDIACIKAVGEATGDLGDVTDLRTFCTYAAPLVDGTDGTGGQCAKLWHKVCAPHCAGGPYSDPPPPLQ